MTAIIDVGGGMRTVYTSGIYDRLMDESVKPEYCIGVSAGSANLITYIAGQRGRTKRFYIDYAKRDEYMGIKLALKKKIFFDLEYVYDVLSSSGGEDPLDFKALAESGCNFYAVATNAKSGNAEYFNLEYLQPDDFSVIKASCAIPFACAPIEIGENVYFDGGIAEPIPYQKAFEDGCERAVVLLTKPITELKRKMPDISVLKGFNERYPAMSKAILEMHEKYNTALNELQTLENEGKILVVSPESRCFVNTVSRNTAHLTQLYDMGYSDAEKIIEFIK